MRRRGEAWVRRLWAGEGGLSGRLLTLLLAPVGALYQAVAWCRNRLYEANVLRVHTVTAPVVSVGNLSVGGTGKTPTAAEVARILADSGARPALLLRGYGEDEVALHNRWNPDVPTYVGGDRVRSAHTALADGARSLVLDDGFQHRRLGRTLDIVLVPATGPWPGRCLPRGPMREGVGSLRRADLALVTDKGSDKETVKRRVDEVKRSAPDVPVEVLDFEPGPWADLDGAEVPPPVGEKLAVTSIGDPDSFVRLVEQATGDRVEILAFPDHHVYDAADAERIVRAAGPRAVVTTEKDAVKLARLRPSLPPVSVMGLRIAAGGGARRLREEVASVVGRSARSKGGRA